MKRRILILSLVILLSACSSSKMLAEHYLDYDSAIEIGYEQLPERARLLHDICHVPNDIKEIYAGLQMNNGKKGYEITFSNGGRMLLDHNGNYLMMENERNDLPSCWTNQIPVYHTMYMTIANDHKKSTKPWIISRLEVYPRRYIVRVNVGEEYEDYTFDKKGKFVASIMAID